MSFGFWSRCCLAHRISPLHHGRDESRPYCTPAGTTLPLLDQGQAGLPLLKLSSGWYLCRRLSVLPFLLPQCCRQTACPFPACRMQYRGGGYDFWEKRSCITWIPGPSPRMTDCGFLLPQCCRQGGPGGCICWPHVHFPPVDCSTAMRSGTKKLPDERTKFAALVPPAAVPQHSISNAGDSRFLAIPVPHRYSKYLSRKN